MTSHDQLMKRFDELEVDVTDMVHQHRKLKRDRDALLRACKSAYDLLDRSTVTDVDGNNWTVQKKIFLRLHNAIAQAESEK